MAQIGGGETEVAHASVSRRSSGTRQGGKTYLCIQTHRAD
jgi:hypothetical protein